MRPFDSIILNEDLPEYGIRAGTEGAIVEQYSQTDDVYMVEFFDNTGKTLDVIEREFWIRWDSFARSDKLRGD